MHHTLVEKKRLEQIDPAQLSEPDLTREEWEMVERGVKFFNEMRFWEAHEVWEEVWKRRREDSRIFFQGIIQAAAGFHLIVERPRYSGAARNLDKAFTKLVVFPERFLGFDVKSIRASVALARRLLSELGPREVQNFPPQGIPKLSLDREISGTQGGRRTPRRPKG